MRITKEQIISNPDTAFIFGDTYYEDGEGKQAQLARWYPNAFGVAVKLRKCYNDETSFFNESHYSQLLIEKSLVALFDKTKSFKKVIVFPKLGLGHNMMDTKCPKLRKLLLDTLREHYGDRLRNPEDLR